MRTFINPTEIKSSGLVNPAVAVGVFDGLHTGHRRLLSDLRKLAAKLGGHSIVITFRIHPRAVINMSGPTFITSLEHRLLLLEREGLDACLLLDFTPELAGMTAVEFSRLYLAQRLKAKALLMGFDSRIGKDGEGTAEVMAGIGQNLGFEVHTFPAIEIGGEAVSSTRIRDCIISGKLDAAGKMLGRPVTVLGTVVKGEGRGRKLGFPTANLDLHHEARPPAGVYGAFAVIDGREMPALVSIGSRPTFHRENAEETIEVHIPGFEGNLYGSTMEVRFIARIRGQREFAGSAELINMMKKDALALEQLVTGTPGETP